jgi:hypothetical protein
VSQSHNRARVILSGRLCENSVHGSTKLTTNDSVSLEINYLSVRPEPSRRAPREFLHSLAVAKDLLFLRALVESALCSETKMAISRFFVAPLLRMTLRANVAEDLGLDRSGRRHESHS